MDFNGINALVVGKGISGQAAADTLTLLGAMVTSVETDAVPPETENADLIVVSPSVRPDHPLFAYAALHDKKIIGEIGLGAMINTKPVIGITGTNGKTTVTRMIGEIYKAAGKKAAVCGNIGVPFSFTAAIGDYDVAVVELSSFQLLNAAPLACHIACITNIDEDHTDYHGSFFNYKRAKLSISDRQTKDDFLLIRSTDDYFLRTDAIIVGVGPVDYEIGAKGLHNKMNAGFAAAAARIDGIDEKIITRALKNFVPDDYRITLTAEINGVSYYNDSKGTNVSATLAAANTMSGNTALIVGGSDKGASFEKLFSDMPQQISCVFVLGQTADRIMCAARLRGYTNIVKCDDLTTAVNQASCGGFSNVLFSPACASFDIYKNYAERGEAYDEAVKGLIR